MKCKQKLLFFHWKRSATCATDLPSKKNEKKIYFWLFAFLAHKVGGAKTHKHGNAAADRNLFSV